MVPTHYIGDGVSRTHKMQLSPAMSTTRYTGVRQCKELTIDIHYYRMVQHMHKFSVHTLLYLFSPSIRHSATELIIFRLCGQH